MLYFFLECTNRFTSETYDHSPLSNLFPLITGDEKDE